MAKHNLTLSVEFFPPQTAEGAAKLRAVRAQLACFSPSFFSCTYGAGGSTQDRTLEIVREIQQDGHHAAPHLSCIGATRDNILVQLEHYRSLGIHHLVALRGDLPSGMAQAGEFRYANELVEFIRAVTGDWFHVEVACYPEVHPQARTAREDLINFKRKIDAGADAAITQYFFNADAYLRFVDEAWALGIKAPIVPGIMPISSYAKLARFSDACGAEIPRWMRRRLEAYGDDAVSIRAFGLDVVTKLCGQLIDGGAPGLHFYTMNQVDLTRTIWRRLCFPEASSTH